MQATTLKLYSLNYTQIKTYLVAVAFVFGNMLLPQLCHLIPQGGLILLPIYFFTLVGAYKFGWQAGLLTALLSPVANYLFFGMPALPVLPAILVKSVLLAVTAGITANFFRRISIPILALVVLTYQSAGTLVEWAMSGDLSAAVQDFRIGIPGMIFQIFGGYLFIKYLVRR